jgi:outer membrane protein TolC
MLSVSISYAQDDLNYYLQIAADNNPNLKSKFNEYMAALEVAPQAKALPDPQIAFAYFIQPIETRLGPQQFKISATQMFPWIGTLKAKENIAIQMAKAKYEVFEENKSKLFNDVRALYYNLYVNQKAIDITLENIDILNSFQKLALIKIESGKVSAVDEYRIEMEIGDLENQLAFLKDKQYVFEVQFYNLLNIDYTDPVSIPETLWETDIVLPKEVLLDSILMKNHQLLNIEFQQESLRYKRELANKNGRPSISLGIDYTFVGQGENNLAGTDAIVFPRVGITIPLYRNKYKAMVQEVVFQETAKQFEKENKSNLLENLFENIWKDYSDAKRRIDLYKSQLELAEKSLKMLETDYTTGNKNFEELLRMERRLLKYNLELEKARADKQASISFITYLTGN